MTNRLPKRSIASRSIIARPPRIAICRRGWSIIMKSMNAGTPASVALPDRSSFGMIRSTSTPTVAYSCAVKNFGFSGVAGFAACAAIGVFVCLPRLDVGPDQRRRSRSGAEERQRASAGNPRSNPV